MSVKPKRIWKRKKEVTIRVVHVFLSTLRILLLSWIQRKTSRFSYLSMMINLLIHIFLRNNETTSDHPVCVHVCVYQQDQFDEALPVTYPPVPAVHLELAWLLSCHHDSTQFRLVVLVKILFGSNVINKHSVFPI